MSRTRFSLFLVPLFLASASGAEAAPREGKDQGPPELSGKYLEQLDRRLELKKDQRAKIKKVLDENGPKIKRAWKRSQKIQKQMKALSEEMKALKQDTQERIRESLDYEQRERFDEMRMRQRQKERQRGRRGGRRGRGRDRPRGVDFDPNELPAELRRKMERRRRGRSPEGFPPERWEEGEGMRPRRDMPPELREHIERKMRRRGRGRQRDVPPVEEWDDRRRLESTEDDLRRDWKDEE